MLFGTLGYVMKVRVTGSVTCFFKNYFLGVTEYEAP